MFTDKDCVLKYIADNNNDSTCEMECDFGFSEEPIDIGDPYKVRVSVHGFGEMCRKNNVSSKNISVFTIFTKMNGRKQPGGWNIKEWHYDAKTDTVEIKFDGNAIDVSVEYLEKMRSTCLSTCYLSAAKDIDFLFMERDKYFIVVNI